MLSCHLDQRNLFRSKTEFRATFESVGGLRSGSPVRMAGVSVGTVSEVVIGDDGKIHVRFGVTEDGRQHIREDTNESKEKKTEM